MLTLDLKILEDWLLKVHLDSVSLDSIKDYVLSNVNSFTYTNTDLQTVDFFVVVKNLGGFNVFKTIKGNIVADMLDPSYSSSRELMCISGWNIKKTCSLSISIDKKLILKEVSHRNLRSSLCSVVEPRLIKYVAMTLESRHPAVINVDSSTIKGMEFSVLRKFARESYVHSARSSSVGESLSGEPIFVVVDYDMEG